jgi:serine/threonine protein kinase
MDRAHRSRRLLSRSVARLHAAKRARRHTDDGARSAGLTSEPPVGPKRCLKCQRAYLVGQRFCLEDGEPLSLPDPYHLVSRTLADRYRLDALVGIGGMGAVYSAWHLAIERRVAVKILQPNIAILDERMVGLFEREAKTVGRLVHENIANVFDAGRTSDGIAYIAMEWLDGGSLEEELTDAGRMTLARASGLLHQIAAALDTAHAAHIVHRDLKPANVMLVGRTDSRERIKRERIKVVDFGIAKAISEITRTTRSIVTGTPAYASPEQLSGGDVDPRSDIYSLGVILYRMLTDALPFDGSSLHELIRQKSGAPRVRLRQLRPDVPLAIEQLVDRMLAPNPDDRPATAGDVSRIFTEAVAAPTIVGPEGTWPGQEPERVSDTTEWLRSTPGLPLDTTPAPPTIASEATPGDNNPLLSEFDFLPSLQDWIHTHAGGGTLALTTALGGLAAILLSHVAGSACIRVALQASSGAHHTLVFGYVAEPNAGLWYLVGTPAFVIIATHFLNLAHSTLRELSGGDRLIVAAEGEASGRSALDLIAERNRRWFRALTPVILLLSFCAVYIPEFASGPGPAFGWVGALSVKDYEGVSIRELQARKRIGLIPAMATLCATGATECDVRVARVTGGHGATDREQWFYPFLVFVIVALGLQVVFGAFAGWIAAKILFLFGILTHALLNRSGWGLKIVLDFGDSEMRFGLGAFDVVHNMVLLLTFVFSVEFMLQMLTNVAKGTSFFTGMAGRPLVSQLAAFVVSLLPLLLILFAPMVVFMILIETEVGRTIESIERERASLRKSLGGATPPHQKASIERAEEHLRRRRDLVRRQRPWPRKNAAYRSLFVATVCMLAILPFTIEYMSVTGGLSLISNAFARFSEILCWLL